MRRVRWIAVSLLLVVPLLTCGGEPAYRGAREDGAVRVSLDVYTPGMFVNERASSPYYSVRRGAYVRLWLGRALTNETDHNVWVARCTALAADGRALFRIRPFSPSLGLAAGDSDVGSAMQPRIRPPVQADDIRGVSRYEGSCETYRWEGPLPPLEES